MKILLMMVATCVVTQVLPCNKVLADNRDHIQNAQALIKKFETEKEAEYLREASFELARITLNDEKDSAAYGAIRTATLIEWLNLLQSLDKHLDPKFDPADGGSLQVQPPKTKDGVIYPPGTDPKLITDPEARKAYEIAIDKNQKRLENYRIQVYLSRLKDSIPSQAKMFIRDNYSKLQNDQNELKSSIKKILKNTDRREEFLKL